MDSSKIRHKIKNGPDRYVDALINNKINAVQQVNFAMSKCKDLKLFQMRSKLNVKRWMDAQKKCLFVPFSYRSLFSRIVIFAD